MAKSLPDEYFLRTPRLGFRYWTPDDVALARELWGDAEVTRFFGGPFSNEEIDERLEREISRMNTHGFQYWPIHFLSDHEHVGCCGLRPYRPGNGVHELGFHLRPRYWGLGLAREAAEAVIQFAFVVIGATALSAGHHPGNLNSKKVIERLGFRYTHEEYFPALQMNIPYYLLGRESSLTENSG